MSSAASLLVGIATAAAVTEFLLLRVLLRFGPMLPSQDQWLELYRVITILGLATLNLAVLAATGYLVVVAAGLHWRQPGDALFGLVLGGAVVMSSGLPFLLALAPAPLVSSLQALTLGAAIAAVLARLWRGSHSRRQWPLMLAGLAQGLVTYHLFTQGSSGLGMPLPGDVVPVFLAEAVAVLAALSLPWAFRLHLSRRHVAIGGTLAAVFLVAHTLRPWLVASLSMWTVSFSLYLPGVLYAGALGTAIASLLALRREPGGAQLAAGLVLVALAGLKLDFTYFALLGLMGILVASRQLLPAVPTPNTSCSAFTTAKPAGADATPSRSSRASSSAWGWQR